MRDDARSSLREAFRHPPVRFRSVPFWSWNGRLREEELVRQIRDMKEHGAGGFFMHSREGLETPFMGEEWMNGVRAAVQAAAELGMEAWIYDEDRWPSGSAGGRVPALGDAYRAKGLTLELRRGGYEPEDGLIALFRAEVQGLELLRCRRLDPERPQSAPDPEVLLLYRVEVSAPSDWFNNETPPDSLNPDTVREFIRLAYEPYKQAVGGQFGRAVRGVFTDEPSVHDRHCRFTEGRGWVPWTHAFPDTFRRKRGHDILDVLPYLFFDGARAAEARHDYWRTVADLFCESYTKQLAAWCEANGLAFTGHYLWENALGVATRVGGAIMPHYRYQHVPGIDMLQEQTDEAITVKQCSSVAHQFGRTTVVSETYGCTGWEFTFEGQKWVGDFQYVLGVNLRSQHLALYTLKGCRKRDYPPVFGHNTTWWKYNEVVEHYFARIGAVMTQGEAVRDVLVLHPASTAWSMLGTNPSGFASRGLDRNIPEINRYGDEFNRFIRYLLGTHYDLDLGDETILEEHGSAAGGRLRVERAEYKTVVIPPIRTMLRSTLRLLLQFAEAGGRIVAVAPLAGMLEGRPAADELQALHAHPRVTVVRGSRAAVAAIEKHLPRRVSLRTPEGDEIPELLYMLRETEEDRFLFIVNNDRDRSFEADIVVEGIGCVEEWHPLGGEITVPEARTASGGTHIRAVFGPAGSRLYTMRKNAPQSAPTAGLSAPPSGEKPDAVLGPVCRFTRTMPNSLTLDRCAYRLNGGEWSAEMDLWKAQSLIRESLGMRQIYYNGLPQRYKWADAPHPNDGAPADFRLRFEVSAVPMGPVHLVLEEAEHFSIRLNGRDIANRPDGWFLDRELKRIPLPDRSLRPGVNELELSCRYLNRMEVEDCYLIGDFAVDRDRRIGAEPKTLRLADWCLQGYFHYAGSIVYHFDYRCDRPIEPHERIVLELGDCSAVTAELRVNGAEAGHMPWKAARLQDVTRWIRPGRNTVDIEVMGSPRNLFGPFHQARGRQPTTDWGSFRREGREYTAEYLVHPYGLLGPISIYRF